MKTKTISLFTPLLLISIIITSNAAAQKAKNARPINVMSNQMANEPANGSYTYRLFAAPNKIFGYDIFRDGKIIFHQPASAEPAGDKQAALNKRHNADKAASLAIEKIKKGMPAELTREELMRITAH